MEAPTRHQPSATLDSLSQHVRMKLIVGLLSFRNVDIHGQGVYGIAVRAYMKERRKKHDFRVKHCHIGANSVSHPELKSWPSEAFVSSPLSCDNARLRALSSCFVVAFQQQQKEMNETISFELAGAGAATLSNICIVFELLYWPSKETLYDCGIPEYPSGPPKTVMRNKLKFSRCDEGVLCCCPVVFSPPYGSVAHILVSYAPESKHYELQQRICQELDQFVSASERSDTPESAELDSADIMLEDVVVEMNGDSLMMNQGLASMVSYFGTIGKQLYILLNTAFWDSIGTWLSSKYAATSLFSDRKHAGSMSGFEESFLVHSESCCSNVVWNESRSAEGLLVNSVHEPRSFFNPSFVESLLQSESMQHRLTSESYSVDRTRKHVVVFVHGYKGHPFDFQQISLFLQFFDRNISVLACKSTTLHTDLSISIQADLVLREVLEYVTSADYSVLSISFVAHSMGGLVVRQLLRNPSAEVLLPKLCMFMSIAVPHDGLPSGSSGLFRKCVLVYRHLRGSQSLRELTCADAPRGLIEELRVHDGLSKFKAVYFVSSDRDKYAPPSTALAESLGSREEYKRLLINFVKESSFAGRVLGRKAHIALLTDHHAALIITKLLHSISLLPQ